MTASRICHDKRETSTALAYFVTEFRNVFPVCHALYYTVALQSTVLGVVEMSVRRSVRPSQSGIASMEKRLVRLISCHCTL